MFEYLMNSKLRDTLQTRQIYSNSGGSLQNGLQNKKPLVQISSLTMTVTTKA